MAKGQAYPERKVSVSVAVLLCACILRQGRGSESRHIPPIANDTDPPQSSAHLNVLVDRLGSVQAQVLRLKVQCRQPAR